MTFQPKSQYLPTDVKDYVAPRPRMDLVWMALAICLAFIGWAEVVPNAAAVQVNPDLPIVTLAERQAHLIASCLNNGAISWIDPHTQHEMLTFCKTHEVKVAQ